MGEHDDIDHTGITGAGAATHIADTSDAHDASAISFTPAGTIAATDVQAAIEEVASEASGGAFDEDLLPWTIIVPAGFGGIANTNWSTFVTASGGGGDIYLNGILQSSGAQNAEVAWDLVLAAGTWSFFLRHYTEANRGIYTLEFDGSSQGTMDGYAGTPGSLVALSSVTGITVATSAKIRVSLAMLTKNASSSSYFGAISGFQLLRTA